MAYTLNPSQTIAPPSSFLIETQGFTQGITLADPSSRQWLLSGAVGSSVTQPVWGGVPIVEDVATPGSGQAGNSIVLATSTLAATGFSVFDRAYSMLIVPGNTVATAAAGMSVAYYRFGSNARVPVPCSAALITAIEGNPSTTAVSWNYTTNLLDTTGSALAVKVVALDTNSKIVSYDSGTGVVSWTTGSVAVIQL